MHIPIRTVPSIMADSLTQRALMRASLVGWDVVGCLILLIHSIVCGDVGWIVV